MEINNYLKSVLENEKECIRITNKLLANGFEFFRNDFSGSIEENALMLLIQNSRKNKNLQAFLSAFLYCLRTDEVTTSVFESLVRFKGKYRDTMLMALCHCPLAIYQLHALAKLNIDDQAFCQLVLIYCKNGCFTKIDLQNLLYHNRHDKMALPELCEEMLKDKSYDVAKIEVVKTFMCG